MNARGTDFQINVRHLVLWEHMETFHDLKGVGRYPGLEDGTIHPNALMTDFSFSKQIMGRWMCYID